MLRFQMSRLINCAAILAALYLPACGEPPITEDPPVVAPPDPGSGVGTLVLDWPSGLDAAMVAIDDHPANNGALLARAEPLAGVKVGMRKTTSSAPRWKPGSAMVNIAEDGETSAFVLMRPMVEDLTATWLLTGKNGQSLESWSYAEETANKSRIASQAPCETGTFLFGQIGALCAVSPDRLIQCDLRGGSNGDCGSWLECIVSSNRNTISCRDTFVPTGETTTFEFTRTN